MTVREAVLGVMRRFGMTTIFGNPGSTEVPFLTDLPGDIRFVLGLHEGTVVGMASGYAIARGEPSFVNLHTAPGLGNAINAIANARDCRAPLVVVVGQQDRRQVALEPFLTGRALERLAGEYPVWSSLPIRAQDVPGAIARAYHEAAAAKGPALVVVPMGDWLEEADELAAGSPASVVRADSVQPAQLTPMAELLSRAHSPVIVVGAGADSRAGWDAVVELAQRLGCWVWQEPFGGRAGFPQDHALFAGHLPWMRRRLREKLDGHDCVLVIGTGALRTYLFDTPDRLMAPGTLVGVITDDPAEAHRSPCDLAVVAPVAPACRALASLVPERLVVAGSCRLGDGPTRRARAARGGRAAAGRARVIRARRAAARRRGARRGDAVEPPGTSTSGSRPGRRSASSRTPTARSASASRARSGSGWDCRIGRWWRSSATVRRCTRSSRCGAPPAIRSACC